MSTAPQLSYITKPCRRTALSSVSRAYDFASDTYDADVDIDRWIRSQLSHTYPARFGRGDRILEIGCGSGIDTEFLARLGCRVTAVDVSSRMLDKMLTRVRRAGLGERVEPLLLNADELGRFKDRSFDGIVSGFGALNTVDLDRLSGASAHLLKPSGRMVLHFVGPCSLWERLHLLSRGRIVEAVRLGRDEVRIFRIAGLAISHAVLPPLVMYERHFSRYFTLEDRFAMGALRPPPGINLGIHVTSLLTRCELHLRHRRPILNWGRFYVLDLQLRRSPLSTSLPKS